MSPEMQSMRRNADVMLNASKELRDAALVTMPPALRERIEALHAEVLAVTHMVKVRVAIQTHHERVTR